jgi:carbamoyltransferase
MVGKKDTYILGISAYYHDSSACLFKNNKLVFACEEEKFTGLKHDSSFPKNVINYIFKKYLISKEDIEMICFYEQPQLKKDRVVKTIKKNIFKSPLYGFKSLYNIFKNQKDLNHNIKLLGRPTFYSLHHDSHLYYSIYSSDFNECFALSIDGVGEWDTATFTHFNGGKIKTHTISKYPHSVGLFYSAMTAFLGFKPNEGEYKVMGLSAYGSPNKYIKPFREFIKFIDGEVICDMSIFNWDRSTNTMFNYKLSEKLNVLPRTPNSDILEIHQDIAAAVQLRYEELLIDIVNYYCGDNNNIVLGGGCAYNGLGNGKLYKKTKIENIWIPPSPSDSGSSVGACINYIVNVKNDKPIIPKTPFIGPSYKFNKESKIKHNIKNSITVDNETLYRVVAKQIYRGSVVGWFRDEIEFGARALGNRSILADPTNPTMKDRINKMVKRREGFRPFAPMVTKERQSEFFDIEDDVPYMNQIVKVKKEFRDILIPVTHVDGTARIQTVYNDNPIFELLREFEKLSSYPILLNTSFNIKDKTMVLTPQDAIETFRNTDLDVLVIQNTIIFKR